MVTVPTPIKQNKIPDLKYNFTFKTISKFIKRRYCFFESTIFSATENISKDNWEKRKIKFYIGYSSERINPGDKINNIKNIKKSSCNSKDKSLPAVKKAQTISKKLIFSENIKEAELSKLIENTQRDLNIALMMRLWFYVTKQT